MPALVPDRAAHHALEERVHRQAPVLQGLGDREPPVGQPGAERHRAAAEPSESRSVIGIPQLTATPHGRRRRGQLRHPQVPGEAVTELLPPVQTSQPSLFTWKAGRRRAAVGLERRRQLGAVPRAPQQVAAVHRAVPLALGDVDDVRRALLAGPDAERRHVELGDHGARAVVVEAPRPAQVTGVHQRHVDRQLPGLVGERAGVLPLRREARRRRDRHRQDLVLGVGVRVGQRDADPAEQLDVRADFQLGVRSPASDSRLPSWPGESAPPEPMLYVSYCAENAGPAAGGAVRGAQLELVQEVAPRPPRLLRGTVGQRPAAERRPPVVGAEQRGAVAADEEVADQLLLVVEVERRRTSR